MAEELPDLPRKESLDAFDPTLIENALRMVFPDDMTNGWVLIVERFRSDGKRWLSQRYSNGAVSWQILGYLQAAIQGIQSDDIEAALRPEGDDG